MNLDHSTTPVAIALVAALAAACGSPSVAPPAPAQPAERAPARQEPPYTFDAAGELVRPTGYREWIYVGTPVTPNDLNDGKAAFPEFHNV